MKREGKNKSYYLHCIGKSLIWGCQRKGCISEGAIYGAGTKKRKERVTFKAKHWPDLMIQPLSMTCVTILLGPFWAHIRFLKSWYPLILLETRWKGTVAGMNGTYLRLERPEVSIVEKVAKGIYLPLVPHWS